MSFIDDVVDFAGGAVDWLTGNSVGASLAKTAALGFIVNQATKSLNSSNSKSAAASTAAPDRGARLQFTPDTNHKIPVVYGTAYVGGIITDAQLADDNKTMWYCVTICERTGALLSTGESSQFIFEDIFWNDNRLVFKADGITADYTLDRDGNVDYSVQGLVKVYCYRGNSSLPTLPDNYNLNDPLYAAYTHMPLWTINHNMDELVFALIRVDYNRDRGITGIPNVTFQITNTMTQPGDCLYDYMTNTRYGAGIAPAEIYSQ